MDIIVEFFRDTLDGPFYIVWIVVLVILIFACIGYLAEKGINKKHEKEKYATVSKGNGSDNSNSVLKDVSEPINSNQVASTPVTAPVVEPVSSPTSSINEVPTVPVQDVNPVSTPPSNGDVAMQSVNNGVVSPSQVESTPGVVNASPSQPEVNNVVIPTINQDGNNNAV